MFLMQQGLRTKFRNQLQKAKTHKWNEIRVLVRRKPKRTFYANLLLEKVTDNEKIGFL